MLSAPVLGLVIAALGGMAIGVERQWSGHADGPQAHFGGVRTFTLLGAIGGISGWLWASGAAWLSVVLLAGGAALVAVGYLSASRTDVDGTTEVAALVVVAAGVIAGLGHVQMASGIVALEWLLLIEKSRLHGWVRRIDDRELRAAARFAVMALVVLPLLPEGPFGPLGGIRPREIWALVLFFSGLSFLGHLLRKGVGPGQGYLLSGLAGGLISSTNVTWTFARMSRSTPGLGASLGFGAIAANAVLVPRVLTAVTVLDRALLAPLATYLAAPAILAGSAAVLGAVRARRIREVDAEAPIDGNPLQLRAAIQMGALFQAVLMIVHLARVTQGDAGIYASAAVLGLTDVDALTISMARDVASTVSRETAARALAIGILSNTVLKAAIAGVAGTGAYRVVASGTLIAMALAGAASLLWNH